MPKLLEIRDFASAGLNTDILAWDLPPQFLTEINNVRIIRNSLSPFGGHVNWSPLPKFDPGMIMHVGATSGTFWLIAGGIAVYVFDGTTFSNITRDGFTSVSDSSLWTGDMLSRIPVINNPGDFPQYWSPQAPATTLTLLPWDATQTWEDVGQSCEIMRSHKQFLFAMKVKPTGGIGETIADGVRWSAPADINSVPPTWDELDTTQVAGLTTLGGDGGDIIDGKTLRDAFCVYRERSISVFDYVGGNFVWQIRHLSTTVGLIGSYCLVEVKGKHFFIGDGDVLVNDGNSIQSLMHHRIRKHFVTNFNVEFYRNAFAVKNNVLNEIWFCIPSQKSEFADLAYIFNWRDDSWTVRDLPAVIHGAYGSQRTGSPTWDSTTQTWDTISSVWNLGGVSPLQDTIVMLQKTSGAFCNVYECDAYETAMVGIFDHLWPLHEADPPTVITDIIGSQTLTLAGTTLEGAPILAGQCGPDDKSYRVLTGAGPYFRNTGYSDANTGLVGGFGLFANAINLLSGNMVSLRFSGSSTKTVGLTYFSTGAVAVTAFGGQQDTQINVNVEDKYVWVNYTMAASGVDLTYEVFVDWISVGTGTIIQTQTEVPTIPVTWVGLGGNGGSGDYYAEFFGIKNSHVTAGEAATLAAALADNAP